MGVRRQELTDVELLRRIAAVLWSIQVDAAAEVEEDEVLCGGGGARAARDSERKETTEEGA